MSSLYGPLWPTDGPMYVWRACRCELRRNKVKRTNNQCCAQLLSSRQCADAHERPVTSGSNNAWPLSRGAQLSATMVRASMADLHGVAARNEMYWHGVTLLAAASCSSAVEGRLPGNARWSLESLHRWEISGSQPPLAAVGCISKVNIADQDGICTAPVQRPGQ